MKIKSKDQVLAEANRSKQTLEELKELNAALQGSRMEKLNKIAQEAQKVDPYTNKDLYIVFVPSNKRVQLDVNNMIGKTATQLNAENENLPEDFYFVRLSCPSPGYNQNVFKYHHLSGSLEYLWTIPRKHVYYHIFHNRLHYLQDKKWQRQASFVLSMESGQLLEWVKKENGEKKDAVIKTGHQLIEA